jgi:hypothetical protein
MMPLLRQAEALRAGAPGVPGTCERHWTWYGG